MKDIEVPTLSDFWQSSMSAFGCHKLARPGMIDLPVNDTSMSHGRVNRLTGFCACFIDPTVQKYAFSLINVRIFIYCFITYHVSISSRFKIRWFQIHHGTPKVGKIHQPFHLLDMYLKCQKMRLEIMQCVRMVRSKSYIEEWSERSWIQFRWGQLQRNWRPKDAEVKSEKRSRDRIE